MDQPRPSPRGFFSEINGTPAHVMIIAGLVLLLAAPLIPIFKNARISSAQAELSQVDALVQLDIEDFARAQDLEREADAEERRKDMESIDRSLPFDEAAAQRAERQKREEARAMRERDRKKAMEDKKEELEKEHDSVARKRALLKAQLSAAGMRFHHVLLFAGNVLFLLGLLVVTLESEGTKQKVVLIILLVAMFSALSGVSLNFLAAGNVGDQANFERLLRK